MDSIKFGSTSIILIIGILLFLFLASKIMKFFAIAIVLIIIYFFLKSKL